MKTKTNHGAEISLESKQTPAPTTERALYLFSESLPSLQRFCRVNNLPLANPQRVRWVNSKNIDQLHGLRSFTVHIIPGQKMPPEIGCRIMDLGGNVTRSHP